MAQAILWGTIGGLSAGAATVIGATPTLIRSRKGFSILSHMSMDFALGMMLAAAAFSLIAPASEAAWGRGSHAFIFMILCIFMGGLFISSLGSMIERFQNRSHTLTDQMNGPWLFVIAMMLHNLPEGLASGAALAGLDWRQGLPILGAISLQNLPEGLTTAVAFRALGASPKMAFAGAAASGGVEFVGGIAGGVLLAYVQNVLPFLLAFAGGAMVYVAGKEAWGRFSRATLAKVQITRDFTLGMMAMMFMSRLF